MIKLYPRLKSYFFNLKFIPLFLLISIFCIFLMSLSTRSWSHPDEKLHFEAAKFYFNFWLPPPVGDPRTIDSYNKGGIGTSYLDQLDIVYFLAGKVAVIYNYLNHESYLSLRFFNLSLFIILLFVTLKASDKVIFTILLISPQIWYIFSYFNGDAFPFFLQILVCYQIADQQSYFNRYLKSSHLFDYWWGALIFGLLLGLLFISKLNYLAFAFFAIAFIIIKILPGFRKIILYKLLLIILTILLVVGLRLGYDLHINGFNKQNTINNFANQIGSPFYRPDADKATSFWGVRLKSKGYPYQSLFNQFKWAQTSFESSIGVYGGMNIFSSKTYYLIFLTIFSSFFLYLIFVILKNRSKIKLILLGISVFFIALTIFTSSYFSWTYDFQAQGRYLFPIYGILALLLAENFKKIDRFVFVSFVVFLFILSVYSFVFTGIVQLIKIA